MLLNALTKGRLQAALTSMLQDPLTPEVLAADPGAQVSGQLQRAVTPPGSPPPASDIEAGVRDAAFRIAALLAFHFQQADPLAIENADAAAPALARFLSAAPPMEQR